MGLTYLPSARAEARLLSWLSQDGQVLLLSKAIRAFAYGFLSISLAVYLRDRGIDPIGIGLIFALALSSSTALGVLVGVYADRFGRKRTLMLLGSLMSISGLVFSLEGDHSMLALAAILGTTNVSAAELSPYASLEQSTIPQTTSQEKRTFSFSIYSTVGMVSAASGALFSGSVRTIHSWLPALFRSPFQLLFVLYALLGISSLLVYSRLSEGVEAQLGSKGVAKLESKRPVAKLAALFGTDAFAGGFVVQAVVVLWFVTRFGSTLDTIAPIFAVANVLTAVSYGVAVKIASMIGLVRTMVFTHIPSNIFLILVGLAPNLEAAVVFYLLRSSLSQMDVPTRQSYVAAIVKPSERTLATGILNVTREATQSVSPSVTGYILQSASYWAPFALGGGIKLVYDLLFYGSFRSVRPPEELDPQVRARHPP